MHVAATLVSQTTPLNIDWGCGLRTNEYAHARTYVCAIVVKCVLNKIMPPIELSVDVDVVVDVVVVVDSRCRIGEMAARIMTKLGTVALQVGAI